MVSIPRLHNDLRRARTTRRGATGTEKTDSAGSHKTYPRMRKTDLPEPRQVSASLSEILEKLSSSPEYPAKIAFSLQACGTLLATALKIHDSDQDPHMIETYLITGMIEGLQPGAFHYDPSAHALELLAGLPPEIIVSDLVRRIDPTPSTLLVLTSPWRRNVPRYGDFAYVLALLEAGRLSQSILLVAGAIGLSAFPISSFDDDAIIRLLDLDDAEEQPVHIIGFC